MLASVMRFMEQNLSRPICTNADLSAYKFKLDQFSLAIF